MSLISEHYSKSISYRMNSTRQRKILELLPDDLRGLQILDVGSASGYFSKILIDKGAIVTAIDVSNEAILEAKKVVSNAFVVDIESGAGAQVLEGKKFDYIIAGEFIEHLFDPERALRYLGGLLAHSGTLVITTPNILLWSHRIRFLFGKFEYADEGVFDKGHLHFFTYNSLVKTTKKCGLEIVRENHSVHPSWFESIGKHLPNLFAFQLIVSVKKSRN